MQLTLNFGYDQVRELTRQLTLEERKRLSQELGERQVEKQHRTDIERNRLPVLSDEEIAERKQRLLDKALQCPILSEEELKKFEEARKEINECRLASW